MVTDCLSQDPTLDSDPVDEQQQPFADQQPQAMQDCSKILMPKYIVGQPHEGSAYPTSGHSQNSVQRYECIAEQPSQQPPQPVISSSSAPYTSSMSSQYCSLGHSMFEPERTQTDQSQPAISTSHGDGYGQVPAHSWSPTVGMPVYGYATSWMDGPPGWTGNQHLPNCHAQVDCYRGVTAAMTPQKPTANIDWLHAHFNHSLFPGVDFSANNQTLLGSNDNILVDSSVAYVGVETSFHQVHGAASSQGLDFSLERGKTSMRAVADMEQRVRC
ncbi:hypothetical protein CI238_13198 [Colletotrichum incanum]|uniref:Uncharacterized protein n=1 Tax=Colletotrichum incanum TaxID=1573173 RepID=A0A166UQH9_COLIC|nr:hypothetical protein CI238_13198 [Colletotrichum incanum]